MLPFHERLAPLGLEATAECGFVLAGGYALSANGISNRPSNDVDLFTNIADPGRFAQAVQALRAALSAADGLVVTELRVHASFAELRVADPHSGDVNDVQLGLDFRRFSPANLSVRPVLDVRDAVAGKIAALWSRGEARDYIDVDAVLQSGRFDRGQILAIGDQVEVQPLDRRWLAARFREAARHAPSVYAGYDVDERAREQLVARYADWAEQIDLAAARPLCTRWLSRTPPVARLTRRKRRPQACRVREWVGEHHRLRQGLDQGPVPGSPRGRTEGGRCREGVR